MHTVYFPTDNSSSCLCDLTGVRSEGHWVKILFVDNLFCTDKLFEEVELLKCCTLGLYGLKLQYRPSSACRLVFIMRESVKDTQWSIKERKTSFHSATVQLH